MSDSSIEYPKNNNGEEPAGGEPSPDEIEKAANLAREVMEKLKKLSVRLALAESCTAGIVSGLLADTKGASSCLWGSFVCYTQEAKVSMLGLDNDALNASGLVCRETACAMAEGALRKSGADIAASVTGLAGPSGDGRVPVGTVWISVISRGAEPGAGEYHFTGNRNSVRYQAAIAVFNEILQVLQARKC